jgi:hypothetical protein
MNLAREDLGGVQFAEVSVDTDATEPPHDRQP